MWSGRNSMYFQTIGSNASFDLCLVLKIWQRPNHLLPPPTFHYLVAPIYFPFIYKAYILLKYSFLWNQNDQVSFDYFRLWVKKHPDATEMTKWLLMEHMTVSLSDDTDTPTFYQTLAGVTHCKFKQTLSPLSAWNLYICTWICTEFNFFQSLFSGRNRH